MAYKNLVEKILSVVDKIAPYKVLRVKTTPKIDSTVKWLKLLI